jgi:hypothetical protein
MSAPAEPKRGIPALPQQVWAPLAAAFLMFVAGGIGFLVGQPWLFPSLATTASLQVETPAQPGARFYNTIVGHGVALAMGFLAVAIFRANDMPGVASSGHLVAARLWAAVLAMGLTTLVSILLRAPNPAAGSTTLLVALGSFRTGRDAIAVIVGVLIVAVVGDILRRLRLGESPFALGRA